MTRVAGHQPHYLPWLGYIDKIHAADFFCLIDTIPFETASFQHRNKIRSNNQEGFEMLTVPLMSYPPGTLLKDIKIDNTSDWKKDHWQKIKNSYERAPYFQEYKIFFEDLYRHDWTNLVDLSHSMVQGLLDFFGIKTKLSRASDLDVWNGKSYNIHAELCRKLGGTTYISGAGKCAYLDPSALKRAGIGYEKRNFLHPVYTQIHGDFIPAMAAIDLLFNCGKDSIKFLPHV